MRAVAVVGPTAAGKSTLAMALAERFGADIVCCDSVQVYRGLDIGSAKPSAADQARVPHHMIDLVDPDQVFSAGDYGRGARAVLGERPAILCGGTGLYLRALGWSHSGVGGEGDGDQARTDDHGERRRAFEAEWEAREAEVPGAVHEALARRDPETAAGIHPNNVVRSLRALWLCELAGRPISEVRRDNPPRRLVELLLLVVDPGVAAVDEAIVRRCAAMIETGWLREVEMLRARGYDARHKAMRSLGYRELLAHLEGETSLDQAIAAVERATRAYARRQRTFFRHQFRDLPPEQIVHIDHPDACPLNLVEDFLSKLEESA
ncbi:tRNA (adenosine(37)-N6)-dimethylallyltransferase MiaA [Pseudenhygromyxa sp. WMMC2535]|uniref:tRNA (adenosine(37)-N6)-dimethylallyltransferase MiaA n=1 Tax=Pseudenhygromyxa sp. WMMC2535 TaxID=2712867 RepID=UPI0015567A7E|nr:tRNA (adenosine(37)-N6)-dimethylallyltransferase MiaA [Pseudenhygromyxa sp. WMMC2535]